MTLWPLSARLRVVDGHPLTRVSPFALSAVSPRARVSRGRGGLCAAGLPPLLSLLALLVLLPVGVLPLCRFVRLYVGAAPVIMGHALWLM